MPLIKITCATEISTDTKTAMGEDFIDAIFETTKKPKTYIMLLIDDGKHLRLGDRNQCALIEFSMLGSLDVSAKNRLTKQFCEIARKYDIAQPEETYVTFGEKFREDWGHNSKTFAG